MQAGKKEDRVELRTGDGKIWNVKLSGLTAIKDGKVGIVKVKKHGHYGSPHTRLLCFDFELQCLYWLKSDDKLQRVTYNESKNIEKMGKSLRSLGSIPSMDDDDGPSSPTSASKHHHTKPRSSRKNFIMLYNIIDIFRGKKTKILQRFSSRKAEEKACLSIICLQRNLDLQAPDEKTALELKEQLKDFYSQSMGFQLLSSHPQTSLRYDPQTYSALADLLHEKVLNFYKATEKRWIEYMETDAACKIVKDLPRLAKNIRIWEVRPSSFSPSDTREESGEKSPRLVLEPEGLKEYLHGNVRKTIQTGIGSSKSKMKHSIPCISMKSNNSLASSNPSFEGQKGNLRTTETKETQKGMVTQHGRVRVDMERKERWGRSIIEVMEALASRLCSDKKRADEIVKQLSLAVKQVEERGKDRQITLTRYFHSTFTKMVAMGAFLESMQQDDSDGDQDFNTAYHNPEILSVLKVCNQFVLVPAADLIKRECLGKRYRTRDYKPHGWYIDIEFHQVSRSVRFLNLTSREF